MGKQEWQGRGEERESRAEVSRAEAMQGRGEAKERRADVSRAPAMQGEHKVLGFEDKKMEVNATIRR
jgi:hypothetical protein